MDEYMMDVRWGGKKDSWMTKCKKKREEGGSEGTHWKCQISFYYNKLYSSQTTLLNNCYKVL